MTKAWILGGGAAFAAALLGGGAYVASKQSLWKMEIMPIKEVCRRFGDDQPFDEAKFKSSEDNEPERAKMACSLLKNPEQYINKDSLEIRAALGGYTGHFFSESFPAYVIYSAKNERESSWQLLFLLGKNEKISKIIVHKN